jgi:N-acetylmuramoyl-L-alanine amidase
MYKVLAIILLLGAGSFKKETTAPLASNLTVLPDAPVVILDVGHGGTDLGAKAQPPYCEEKKLCLQTARLVKKHLNQLGYRVVMTREADAFVSLARRVEIASQASGDLFVSIHYNSTRSPAAKGIEIFFYETREDRARSKASRDLADSVLSRVIRRTEAVSRGVKRGNFYVIREAAMPAILVEGGFISNPEERSLLKTRDYQEKIARGIVDGIDHFFKKSH